MKLDDFFKNIVCAGLDLSIAGNCAIVDEGYKPKAFVGVSEGLLDNPPVLIVENKKDIAFKNRIKLGSVEQTAIYLLCLKQRLEKYHCDVVSETVISVPVHFSSIQRQAVRNAAKIAGMYVKYLISDPVASSITNYCRRGDFDSEGVTTSIVLKDGFFEYAVSEIGDGVIEILEQNSYPIPVTEEDISTLIQKELVGGWGYALPSYKKNHDILIYGEDDIVSRSISVLNELFPNANIIKMGKDSLALGAAIIGAKFNGIQRGNWVLLDVFPHALSVRTDGNNTTVIIEKNTTIPRTKTFTVSTIKDNQKVVAVELYEGEKATINENHYLGTIKLDQIESAKKGTPQIEVRIDVDARGSITIEARNKKTDYRNQKYLYPVDMSEEDAQEKRPLLREFLSSQLSKLENDLAFEDGVRSILMQILPVLDNFDRALETATTEHEFEQYLQGFAMIRRQLLKNLDEAGVTQIECIGKNFDPHYHSAAMHVDDPTVGENLVIEEFQKGYMYKEKVLRHSLVKVAN